MPSKKTLAEFIKQKATPNNLALKSVLAYKPTKTEKEKVVFGWKVINVQDTQTFSLDKSKNLV